MPCTHDGHLHVHRVAAMRHAWENGVYFSRWLPDLAFGYGYPFFVYREPGPLYAMLLPHLAGLPLPAASNLFYALSILAAGWFMFLWVRDVAGLRAALVSAVAYMAAPYMLIDALVRGNAPESMALPLFPFLLWAGRRWIIQGTAVPFLLGVSGLALLSLSHNISIFIFAPTLLIYLLVIGRLHNRSWSILLGRLTLLFVLGLGVTLFYTGGALLEMDQVTLSQSTVTRNNDFHFNFSSWQEILAPITPEDPNLLNPPLLIRLGWAPLALALLGALTPWWKRWINTEQRWHVFLMVTATAVYLFMALPVSLPLWEKVPLIDFVQFPWRFVGRAALPVAFLAGMPFISRPELAEGQQRLALNIAAVIAVALLLLEAVPALYPRYCDEDTFPTIVDVHEYEAASGLVGVDPEGSYFPRTVRQRPKGSPLQSDYAAGQIPQRFDLSLLPAQATADITYEPLGAIARITSPQPFQARYLSFAFPGWAATIDGQAVPVTPSDPEGLITFAVPEGEHIVEVRWQLTPLRSALALLSILALIGTAVAGFLGRTQPKAGAKEGTPHFNDWSLAAGLILLVVGLLAFKYLLADNNLTPLHRPGLPAVDAPAALQAAELQFAGHTLSQDQVAAGDTFDVDLAWVSTANTLETYQSNVWLADGKGLLWSDKETQRPRQFEDGPATWERDAGQWAWDSREVQVLSGTPPGSYDVVLTLFNRATLEPVTIVDETGAAIGPTAVIGQIEVTMPDTPPAFQPQYPLEQPLAHSDLTLLGYSQDRSAAAPGDLALLTLFWERTGDLLPQEAAIELVDRSGNIAHTWPLPLIREGFGGDVWEAGQRLRAQHLLRLPATLESGRYQLRLQDENALGELQITAPERSFSPPDSAVQVSIPFGEQAALAGYTTTVEEDQLTVELVWQAQQEIDTAYRVFVHLVDESGVLLSQSDAEPAGWARPTTGWVPGEYIVDRHTLPLPEKAEDRALSLRVGLYDPLSGQRLMIGGSDAAELPLAQ